LKIIVVQYKTEDIRMFILYSLKKISTKGFAKPGIMVKAKA